MNPHKEELDMVKITDQNKNYAYIYATTQKEMEQIKKLFETQIVDNRTSLEYKDFPAVLVRKSN